MSPPTSIERPAEIPDPANLKKAKSVNKKVISPLEVTEQYKNRIDTEFKAQDETPGHYKYDHLRPSFPDFKEAPLELQEYEDAALRADPNYPNLLALVSDIENLTPRIGTVLHGVNLGDLNDAAKDELALLTANRGVVFFRNQQDFDIKQQLALGRYWGNLHRHSTTPVAKGHVDDSDLLDVHVVWSDEKRPPHARISPTRYWHSDVSYELQPPSYTTLKLVQGPDTGGDTLWTSLNGIYDHLSPQFQEYLESLEALHSAKEQADEARRNGLPVRREPVTSRHPVVRTNPVTGHKAVYVNPGFTRAIVGVPTIESENILKLLFTLIATDIPNTVRWKWQEGDIALWDNRSTVHSASWGFYPHRRHAVRVTVTAEKPYYDPAGTSQQGEIDSKLGIKSLNKNGAGGNYNDLN